MLNVKAAIFYGSKKTIVLDQFIIFGRAFAYASA